MDRWGIELEYEDAFRTKRKPPESTIAAIRRAMDGDDSSAPLANLPLVVRRGETNIVGPAELMLEDGSAIAVNRTLPPDLPLGYHQLRPRGAEQPTRLIVSPGVCPLPPQRHMWGWAVQLYATRSKSSWGLGDLADLHELARWSKELGAGLLMINPLHAAAPALPQEASPYYPSSRSFRNPIYLRIEDIPVAREVVVNIDELAAAGRALNTSRTIDRDTVFRLKQTALRRIFERFRGDPKFDKFLEASGERLTAYATFCALAEELGRDYRTWPAEFRHPSSSAVAAYRDQHASRVRYYSWLEWLVDRQLADAARELPIMQDLSVGFDPGGADAWMWQDMLAREMSVGAPPDLHNPWGQDWGLPPFVPHKLAAAGFEPFIQTVREALGHAGGLRIDHAMAMFRLFWIPQGAKPHEGTYVNYPAKAMLDIVALESHRAGAFIVAEDLGTVEDSMRKQLMQHQMLSYRLLWLEDEPPSTYPERSMAAVTTHDLYTVAGLWSGSDFRNQQSIGLKPSQESVSEVQERIIKLTDLSLEASPAEAVIAIHRLLAQANSIIVSPTLEDALLVEERPNMPGTTDQWPNWKIALPATIEEIESRPLARQISEILTARKSELFFACNITPRTQDPPLETDSNVTDSDLVAAVEIRQFALADESAVLALWRQVFADDPPHHDPRESIRLKLTDQPELFFVALHASHLVGTIMAGYDGHRGWIYRVAVNPRFQRQGIGTALVRHAEAALVARGAPKINLQVRSTNAQVVAFYEQLGYVVEPRVSMGKRMQ